MIKENLHSNEMSLHVGSVGKHEILAEQLIQQLSGLMDILIFIIITAENVASHKYIIQKLCSGPF